MPPYYLFSVLLGLSLLEINVNSFLFPILSKSNKVDPLLSSASSNQNLLEERIPKLGIGTWAWGDPLFWNYNSSQDILLQATFNKSLESGIPFFDTAEIYGTGKSELLIGRFSRQFDGSVANLAIATKFAPLPWRLGKESVVSACRDSLDRLGTNKIALYQIHFPGVWQNEEYWDGLAECYHQGLVEAVGVSNYGTTLLKSAYKRLKSRGVPLASNQIPYSLLARTAESNGVIRTAKELGVSILAYSPLAQGILTGKFDDKNLPQGPRSATVRAALPKVQGLLKELRSIASIREKTMSQVALNWCIVKGTIPIPGARTVSQVLDNAGSLGWELEKDEVTRLDIASRESAYAMPSLFSLQ